VRATNSIHRSESQRINAGQDRKKSKDTHKRRCSDELSPNRQKVSAARATLTRRPCPNIHTIILSNLIGACSIQITLTLQHPLSFPARLRDYRGLHMTAKQSQETPDVSNPPLQQTHARHDAGRGEVQLSVTASFSRTVTCSAAQHMSCQWSLSVRYRDLHYGKDDHRDGKWLTMNSDTTKIRRLRA